LVPVDVITAARKSPNNDNALINLDPNVFASPGGPQTLSLPCGQYYLSGINVGATPLTIVAHGNTALYIDGDIKGNYLGITLDPKSVLDVFIKGNVSLSGDLDIGSPNYPARVRVYFGSTSFPITGNTTIGGNVWAGRAPVKSQSPVEIYGALFVASYNNTSDFTAIHYDLAVLQAGKDCPPPGQCRSCTDCGNQACVNGACGKCTMDSQCCSPLVCQPNGICAAGLIIP
jgi:hypothetical protein